MKDHSGYKAGSSLFPTAHDILERSLQHYISQRLQHFKHTSPTPLLDPKWPFPNSIHPQAAARRIAHHQKGGYLTSYSTVPWSLGDDGGISQGEQPRVQALESAPYLILADNVLGRERSPNDNPNMASPPLSHKGSGSAFNPPIPKFLIVKHRIQPRNSVMKMCIQQGDAGWSLPLAMIQSLVAYLRQTRLLHCCTMAQIRKSTLSMMKTPVMMTATMPTSQSVTRAMLATKKGATATMYAQLPVNHPGCQHRSEELHTLTIMETV